MHALTHLASWCLLKQALNYLVCCQKTGYILTGLMAVNKQNSAFVHRTGCGISSFKNNRFFVLWNSIGVAANRRQGWIVLQFIFYCTPHYSTYSGLHIHITPHCMYTVLHIVNLSTHLIRIHLHNRPPYWTYDH